MKKVNWLDWTKYKSDAKEKYPFWFVNSKNEVQAYEVSEKKQYKQALRFRLIKLLNKEI